jgi:hypothetical protein
MIQGDFTKRRKETAMPQRLLSHRALLFLFLLAWPASAWAGGGPENLLLVVNPNSPASLCIANHYIQLREIPAENVLYLPWDPKAGTADVETFRKQILIPILRMIDDRRLQDQIDMVIYSSDFPWLIDLSADVNKLIKDETKRRESAGVARSESKPGDKKSPNPIEWPTQLPPIGSINGLTYLWQAVLTRNPSYYCDLHTNHYMRLPIVQQRDARSAAFRGNRLYDVRGEVVASGGRRYFLSTMLGVTIGRGNTPAEVLAYLRRSAKADGTHPKGTIYFLKNDDIRSKVRHDIFPTAVSDLEKLDVNAQILQGTVPLKKSDVQGVVMGTASFDWKASGSTILPGAICEHFTSFGGVMTSGAGQTPLSEFLRFGAAGSCGAVTEPYAILAKFPSPMIQVHYARGCTLAEAFYQSVYGPYQLLIVGDPLCRPWADIPQVSVPEFKAGATVRGRLKLEPSIASSDKNAADHFELFVDGVRVAKCDPGKTLPLDTATLADGYHELRVVAVGSPPIESQGRQIIPIRTTNHNRTIQASLVGRGPWRADQPLTIDASSPGSIGIAAMHGSKVVGRVDSDKGKIVIPASTLGAGPVRIHVIGLGSGDSKTNVAANPLEINLQ